MTVTNRSRPAPSTVAAVQEALRAQAQEAIASGDPKRAAAGNALLMGGRELAETLILLGRAPQVAPPAPTSSSAPAAQTGVRPWETRVSAPADRLTRTPDYKQAVGNEVDAMRRLTLVALLSPAGSQAYDAMITTLEDLLRPRRAPGAQPAVLVDPEAKAVVENKIDELRRITLVAAFSPGGARAYEDMIAALGRLVGRG